MKDNYDVVVIGGGPSGMQAALSAKLKGANVLLLERDKYLGGILNQCIHNGFGLKYFGEELTGPEYADKLAQKVLNSNIDVSLESFVTSFDSKSVNFICPKGNYTLNCKAIVLATGCRERTAGAISLCGNRVAGIYPAGSAQKMINHYGKLPGKTAVILGSGDIGLIMARRLTLEGVKVKAVIEIMPNSSGLPRNIRQCLEDFSIPLYCSHTITKVIGKNRVEKIYYAKVNENLEPILETEKCIKCDCVLLSVGLIPETDIAPQNVALSNKTKGAVVNELRQTSVKSIFTSGNVLQIHDLADNASIEGEIAGTNAALFALGKIKNKVEVDLIAGENISYAIPQKIRSGINNFSIYFRTKSKMQNKKLVLVSGETEIFSKFYRSINSSVLEEIKVDNKLISENLTIKIE